MRSNNQLDIKPRQDAFVNEIMESSLIGALLCDNAQFNNILPVSDRDFYDEKNSDIFVVMHEAYLETGAVDIATLEKLLKSKFGKVRGEGLWLRSCECVNNLACAANANQYAKEILKLSQARKRLLELKAEEKAIYAGQMDFLPDWPEPQSIKSQLYPVPAFNPLLLPEPIRKWCVDVSERMQVPLEYMAVSVITIMSSLIGTSALIQPKQHDTWVIVPNLWGGIVGNPSNLKTPTLNEAMRPLKELQNQAYLQYENEMKKYDKDKEQFDEKKKGVKKALRDMHAKKFVDATVPIAEIEKELAELIPPEKPMASRYYTSDSTTEKLGELLVDNTRGLLVFSDELMSLLASFEKQGRESDRTFYLSAWSGDSSYSVDRIGRGSLYIPKLCISLVGTIQPAKLKSYVNQSQSVTKNDGLLQRFQLLVYPDKVHEAKNIDKMADIEAYQRAVKIFTNLDNLNSGLGIPYKFSEKGQLVFNEWIVELQNKIRQVESSDETTAFAEHLGKFRSLMPSLALIFHLIVAIDFDAANPCIYISKEDIERACAWCEILEAHAKRIYGLIATHHQRSVEALARKIKERKLPSIFTSRELYRNQWQFLTKKEDVESAIDKLLELGWLRECEVGKKLFYKVNPRLSEK